MDGPTDRTDLNTPSPAADHTHLVSNGKRTITLDELGSMQPGTSRLMVEIGDRMWKCWHAGLAGNAPLARYQYAQAVKLLKLTAFVRPKYETDMAAFLADDMEPIRQAIAQEDWAAFRSAFDAMTTATNRYHRAYDHGYLVWRAPEQPPADLDLTPRPD